MKLPHPDDAIIEMRKLLTYCLDPEHSEGQHKARVFRSALGLTQDNAEELVAALLEAVRTHDAVPIQRNPYGQKYVIDFMMTRGDRQALIHSVWIVRDSETFPRLITCYIL
ncbi:MAG: hypothetical protein HC852_23705 [Acaryochloridaceae cyanobacterium RU_4_10]|nr:hypothetical protein [Acaryochloridaceae cyanobacterium RU_4_10]